MGDYNADPEFDFPRTQVLARNFNFLNNLDARSDQWSIDSAHRVSSFCDGTKRLAVKMLVDPRNVPLT